MQYGIEILRKTVAILNNCNESFNMRFKPSELTQLVEMMLASGWDITPDQWSSRQVEQALQGISPRFSNDERPNYYAV